MRNSCHCASTLFKLILILTVCLGGMVHAHTIKIFAAADAEGIHGRVYFPGGARAAGMEVNITGADGTILAKVVTDASGEFSYLPDAPDALTFVVNTADGHRAEFCLPGQELPLSPEAPACDSTGPSGTESELARAVEKAVSRQLVPLRQQLDQYQQQVRIRDIIGAVGYIFGVMGLIMYLKCRKN